MTNPSVKITIFFLGDKDQDPKQTACKQLKTLFKLSAATSPTSDPFHLDQTTHALANSTYFQKLIKNRRLVPFLLKFLQEDP